MGTRPEAVVGPGLSKGVWDVERARQDFPILHQEIHGVPLVYLDNAATSQKPKIVIQALRDYYERDNANIHRGVHSLSQRATQGYENSRLKVQRWIHAADRREIVFVRGTTEAVNLVAHSFAAPRLAAGDEIIVSWMEHHSNIVPWQLLCQRVGAHLRVIPISERGELDLEGYRALLNERTRLVAVAHVSNALGTVNPVAVLIEQAREKGVPVLLDGAQAAPHMKVDVQALDCDFYAFSGHKFFGPTGIGVLYGRLDHLEAMLPYQGGGEMIRSVTFEKTTFNEVPNKFEAGTPNIAGTIGLGAAIDYLGSIDFEQATRYEDELLAYATEALMQVPELRVIGTAPQKAGVISFDLSGIHPHDVGTILDRQGIAVRTGHHCAQPTMDFFEVSATTRASFSFYNTKSEVDRLVTGLKQVIKVFK